MKPKRGYRRGYPVAILAGLEDDRAALWKVFSKVVKPEKTLLLDGTRNDPKAVYNFHESIVNALRPTLNEGVRSIILASPTRTKHTQSFIHHIRGHHAWLVQGPNRAIFQEIAGSANTLSKVATLTRTPMFHRLICETNSKETENLIDILEERLYASNQNTVVLYSIEEAEDFILGGEGTPHHPVITFEI